MVGVPKIIYPFKKKKKNSKSTHNQVLKFLTQLSPAKQFITASLKVLDTHNAKPVCQNSYYNLKKLYYRNTRVVFPLGGKKLK